VLAKHTTLGADGLWWSFPITNIVVALVSVCWFARGSWKTKRLTEDDHQIAKIADHAMVEEGAR
jgi:Na+-driven multidrug efflux pump